MSSLSWYINLYYKFREYPIAEINVAHKPNELRSLYTATLKKIFTLFQLDNRRDGEIEGLISKNNYDHILNKKAETNLEQQQNAGNIDSSEDNNHDSFLSRNSLSSVEPSARHRDSSVSLASQDPRWLVQAGPHQKNMDVFYELMIKMIRISLRRLTIQAFALQRYGKSLNKESVHEIIKNNSEYSEVYSKMEAEGCIGGQSDPDENAIKGVSYPNSVQQLKYQFLKYCITCKIYNNPIPLKDQSSQSLVSYESSPNTSALEEDKTFKAQETPKASIIGDNEIETLILKVSDGETSVFNHFIDLYLEEIRKGGNNQVEILGMKDITQSVFEMALGGQPTFHSATNSLGINRNRFRRGIFDERGEYAKQSQALSNSNLLLATWFDLILFKQKPGTLYEIIDKLVTLSDHDSYLESIRTAQKQEVNNSFYLKMLSYFHLLVLNSTKNLYAQSLSKINYLLVLSQQILAAPSEQPRKSFKDLKLKSLEIKSKGQSEFHENIKLTYDCKTKKYLWREEAMEFLLKKWKVIANVITEVCVKDPHAFYALIFEQCAQLLDQQLSLQVELINQLMNISQNLIFEGQIKQKQSQKCDQIRMNLYSVIQQIIGHPRSNRHQEAEEDCFLGINSFANFKSQSQRYRERSFANREESTQELSKWNQIISENIYIYSQYLQNLKQIMRLFKNNHLYIALWFNKFHSETKTLLRKLNKTELQRIFTKFLKEIPIMWESMVLDQDHKKQRRVRRVEKSKFRNRISSIKSEGPLCMNAKKAIVLNYIIKAELELYSHYMHMNTLNGQRNIAEFFEKEGNKKEEQSKPQFFAHPLIRSLLLFNCEDEINKNMTEVVPIRKNKRQFTSFPMEPRSFIEIENTKTMNNIDQGEGNNEIHQLMKILIYFDRPIDIELELKDSWKDRFGQGEVSFLGEISDYIRYLNEINYMYQFYNWNQETSTKRQRIELLNGSEFHSDLMGIDSYFKELQKNEQFINELELMKGEKENLIIQEQISELHKRIKIHNKELYMINQTIFEAEHHYKLLAANLIGRERGQKFNMMVEEAISAYKNSKREKPVLKLLDKISETSLRKNPSWGEESQSFGGKNSFKDAMKDSSLMSKFGRKNLSFLSQFEFTPEYYKISSKILRLNCLTASFDVDNSIFRNIKSYRVLSKERIDKLSIIGSKYYERLSYLISVDKSETDNELLVDEQLLIKTKNVYEKKLLLLMSTLFTMSYQNEGKIKCYSRSRSSGRRQFSNIPEEHLRDYNNVLLKYSQILRRFIFSRVQENIKRMEERQRFEQESNEGERKEHNQFSICRFVQQVLQLSEKRERFGEEALLVSLEEAVENEKNLKFCKQFRREYQKESNSLSSYQGEEEKVEYLRKRLVYLIMREMYFTLNYDNSFLEEKSVNSKRNYGIYEQRINSFYTEIIKIDYEEYMERREEEMKKRSLHLKNYEFKYEKQPAVCPLQKNINQLICCLFNQLLNTYTSNIQYRMFTHNHKPNQNSHTPHQLFHQYCASQYSKKIEGDACGSKPQRRKRERKEKSKAKDSIVSIFAQIFSPGEALQSIAPNKPDGTVEKQAGNSCFDQEEHITVFVYTEPKFQLSQSIKVYLKSLGDWQYHSGMGGHKMDEESVGRNLRIEPITQMQLQMMRLNERSLITMLKSQYLQKIQEAKSKLIRMNLLANIEKLYINIDVRHKVFESFKDRILNYEMQKTKIYHQYMDYIRGLKLDVYSHMAGEESLPYIKIIHAVKLLRLNIKKMELEQRVGQEFEKNLQKWNQGIQKNMQAYDTWLQAEFSLWLQNISRYKEQKKNLLDIFHAVSKEMARQNKVIPQKKNVVNSSCKQLPQLQPSQLKPLTLTKSPSLTANFFFLQKQHSLTKKSAKDKPFRTTENSALKRNYSETTKPTNKEKLSIICKSREGPRGLSLKYDTSQINVPSEEQLKAGRRTQAFQEGGKTSSVFMKKAKRHLSAQKFRSQLEEY